jgi:hypothetical protein
MHRSPLQTAILGIKAEPGFSDRENICTTDAGPQSEIREARGIVLGKDLFVGHFTTLLRSLPC